VIDKGASELRRTSRHDLHHVDWSGLDDRYRPDKPGRGEIDGGTMIA